MPDSPLALEGPGIVVSGIRFRVDPKLSDGTVFIFHADKGTPVTVVPPFTEADLWTQPRPDAFPVEVVASADQREALRAVVEQHEATRASVRGETRRVTSTLEIHIADLKSKGGRKAFGIAGLSEEQIHVAKRALDLHDSGALIVGIPSEFDFGAASATATLFQALDEASKFTSSITTRAVRKVKMGGMVDEEDGKPTIGGEDVIAAIEDELDGATDVVVYLGVDDQPRAEGGLEVDAGWEGTAETPGEVPMIQVGNYDLIRGLGALSGSFIELVVEEAKGRPPTAEKPKTIGQDLVGKTRVALAAARLLQAEQPSKDLDDTVDALTEALKTAEKDTARKAGKA